MTKTTIRKRRGAVGIVTSCISTTLVLVLLGIVAFFVTMADNLSRSMRENFTVQKLLSDSLTHGQTYQLQSQLRRQPCVLSVNYVSKDKATQEQAQALGTDPVEFLGSSPIPASFELHLKADYTDRDSLNRYMPRIKKMFGVTDVVYPQDLMESVNHNIYQISIILLVVAALLLVVSFSLINNVVRLSIYSRRRTIHTMKLVGASWSFIRRPFLRRAFWIGVVSAAIADGVLCFGILAMIRWDADVATLVTWPVWAATMGIVAVCGIVLTLLCALVSVNRFLRMKSSKLMTE